MDLQPPDDLYDDATVDSAVPGGRGAEPAGHVHCNDVDEGWQSGLEPPIHPEDAPHAVDTEVDVDVGRDRHIDARPGPAERGGRPADPAHGSPSTASYVAVAVPGQPRDRNGVGKQSRPETGHAPLAAAETGSDVSRDRLLELNGQAAAFFTAGYPGSWAVGYLWERLGTDLSDDPRFPAGCAPASWTALTDHLRSLGASDPELLAAGLSSQARTGRLIDRLILPIQTTVSLVDGGAGDTQVVGFIGRRNPDTPDAGPKYLNTSETALFIKGAQLYGAAETAAELAAGATPVLVEGPLDAIAVTLAADGAAVGVAPLGTAFTDAQADSLRRYLGPGRPGVVVATDADEAGQKAAVQAYWQLTAGGGNPTHLVMPDGHDPASLLQSAGPAALRQALTNPPTLARTLIDARVAQFADRMQHAEGPFLPVRAAAEAIGALPHEHWLEHIDYLNSIVPTSPGESHLAVLDAGHAWTADPDGFTRKHLAERNLLTRPQPPNAQQPLAEAGRPAAAQPKPVATPVGAAHPAARPSPPAAKQ